MLFLALDANFWATHARQLNQWGYGVRNSYSIFPAMRSNLQWHPHIVDSCAVLIPCLMASFSFLLLGFGHCFQFQESC